MAYQIQYGSPGKQELLEKVQNSKRYKTIKFLLVCAALFTFVILGKMGKLDFLIPGDKVVTQKAFNSMVQEVKEGAGVKNAITAFCEEVLVSAKG